MIVERDGRWYVDIEWEGVDETVKGPFKSRDEAVRADEEVGYHMRVSAYKMERGEE